MKVIVEEKKLFAFAITTTETVINFNFIADNHLAAFEKVQRTLAEALQYVTESIPGGGTA